MVVRFVLDLGVELGVTVIKEDGVNLLLLNGNVRLRLLRGLLLCILVLFAKNLNLLGVVELAK